MPPTVAVEGVIVGAQLIRFEPRGKRLDVVASLLFGAKLEKQSQYQARKKTDYRLVPFVEVSVKERVGGKASFNVTEMKVEAEAQ